MNIQYQSNVYLIIINLIFLYYVYVKGQMLPSSPCPKIFQYRFNGIEWYGHLTLLNTSVTQELHLKIIMSLKGKPLTSFLGEIELLTRTRGQFYENNLPILYKIKFPLNHIPPKLNQILVNNQIKCFGQPDRGVFVTVIQLEHTRKFKYVSENKGRNDQQLSQLPQVNDETYPMNMKFSDENMNYRSNSNNCGQTAVKTITSDVRFSNEQEYNDDYVGRGTWPWLTAIYVNNLTSLSYQCGGTLISSRIVISSAHCFQLNQRKYRPNEILVFLGRYNLKNWNEDGSLAASCDEIYIHPDYDMNLRSFDADIAVLILRNIVRFNEYIRPICLWTGSTELEYIEGERGVVIGWGRINEQIASTIPRKIVQTVSSNWRCRQSNRKFQTLTSNRTFCAIGDIQNHRSRLQKHPNHNGPCSGDSGVGLMIRKNNRWMLRGIVSASIPKNDETVINYHNIHSIMICVTNEFVIYTDVGKFLDWIYAFII